MKQNHQVPFQPRPPVNLQLQEQKLNDLLKEVSVCVNRKVKNQNQLDEFKKAFRTVQPKNLKGGQLKDYQKQALVWMIQLAHKKMNGILADDMGLGKTIQTISYFAYLKQEHDITGKHLIICPLTVCNNWQRELKKWMPNLHVEILWGTEEARQHALSTFVKSRNFDVLITPYHSAVSCVNILKKIPWEVFIIDEAHKIKNDEAILTESVKQFNASFKMLLTGTPLSNNLRELWSLLNFIMPDIFDDRDLFDQIEEGINSYSEDENQKFEKQCNIAKKFHGLIRPFIMRRTKKEIDLGLPPKTQHTLYVSMTKLQLKLYKNYLKYKNIYGMKNGYQNNSQMTTRKICNHPYLFPQIQEEGAEEYGQHLIQNCGKMIVLDKLLAKIIGKEKRKVLIFSQFKIQLDLLEDYCNLRNYNYCRLDGETDIQSRQEYMDAFNNDKNYDIPIFMLSTRAGGLGINLVSASAVIIYDIDWNPQNDAQAMDRAYRIGQKRSVNVYKMVTQHTIEERMLQVQKYKLIWDELVIQKGTIMNIRNEDIFSGLNYEKIANMKKGEVFKIQASKDNKTIDEIIEMGAVKDQKKYKQIKEKVMKQIQEQQNKSTFNANPFEDHEFNDKEGDELLRKFNGEALTKDKRKNQSKFQDDRNLKRAKINFMSQLFVPEFFMIEDSEGYKQLIWERELLIKQLDKLEEQSNEDNNQKIQKIQDKIKDFDVRINKIEENSFCQWKKQEYVAFLQQQREQLNNTTDNIAKLHDLIPQKSTDEIQAFKEAFYGQHNPKHFPKLCKDKNQTLKKQEANLIQTRRSQFHHFLKQSKAVYSRNKAPIESYMNNLRISEGIISEKEFSDSDSYLNDEFLTEVKKFEGLISYDNYEDKLLNSKNLLKKFFKSADTFTEALNNPEKEKLVKTEFQEKRARILAQVNRVMKSTKNTKVDYTDPEKVQQIKNIVKISNEKQQQSKLTVIRNKNANQEQKEIQI